MADAQNFDRGGGKLQQWWKGVQVEGSRGKVRAKIESQGASLEHRETIGELKGTGEDF